MTVGLNGFDKQIVDENTLFSSEKGNTSQKPKTVTLEALDEICSELMTAAKASLDRQQIVDPSFRPECDLGKTLEARGYSRVIENLDFRELKCFPSNTPNKILKFLNFKDVTLRNCNFTGIEFFDMHFEGCCFEACSFEEVRWVFSGIHKSGFKDCNFDWGSFLGHQNEKLPASKSIKESSFEHCSFKKAKFFEMNLEEVTFNGCSGEEVVWNEVNIKKTLFEKCLLLSSSFTRSQLNLVRFEGTDLTYINFHDTHLQNPTFSRCKLEATNFLEAQVERGEILHCDLTDTLLLDQKDRFTIQGGTPHTMKKPIIALGWTHRSPLAYGLKIAGALRSQGAICMMYEQDPVATNYDERYRDLDLIKLNDEVAESLSKASQNRCQALLSPSSQQVEIPKIQDRAVRFLKYAHGLVVPGGDDIDPILYCENPSKRHNTDLRRSVLEVALLAEAQKKRIPTLGVCRGAQMMNVFKGGTLHSNVKGHRRFHQLKYTQSRLAKPFQKAWGKKFVSLSQHHQGIDQLGQGLEVVMKYRGIPKLLTDSEGLWMASQFHPESYFMLSSSIPELVEIYKTLKDLKLWKARKNFNQFAHRLNQTLPKLEKIQKHEKSLSDKIEVFDEDHHLSKASKSDDDLKKRWKNLQKIKALLQTRKRLQKISSDNRQLYGMFIEMVKNSLTQSSAAQV